MPEKQQQKKRPHQRAEQQKKKKIHHPFYSCIYRHTHSLSLSEIFIKMSEIVQKEMNEELSKTLNGVYELRDSEGNDASYVFQTLPDRRLTTYYKTIKRPVSLYMIKQNINHSRYDSISKFVIDLCQITHNARVFNRKDSVIYEHAVILDNYIREQLERLRTTGKFPDTDLEYPDMGPLPEGGGDGVPSLNGGGAGDDDDVMEDEDDEDAEEEEDEDIDDDDDDDASYSKSSRRSSHAPGRRGRPRRSTAGQRKKKYDDVETEEAGGPAGSRRSSGVVGVPLVTRPGGSERKKRGRPPTVDKPHEHRIKAIMRGVRKEKEPKTNRLLYQAFEKLPDFKNYPEYYVEVQEPIALDMIRKNIKRRKYSSVDMFLVDMNLMFNNAKQFNTDGSEIYQDAVHLQQIMMTLAEEEMKKPDSVYQDPDSNSKTSRLPLDQVEHRGEIYRVGDWVHISNLNDPAKPTIGQVFRIWKASDGQKWINACWYYRPEQTVHRYDKLFYENEVVKSGQYRDHIVDEILEKCFVMFFTKYQRGRPSGIGDRSVYCCESRYNENEKTFNKIRTWKACIPDEVRSTDYPMDLFDRPHPLRRVLSPIRHLLPDDAKEDDPIPEPKMGVSNAPPIVGAVYKRPVDPNEPPEQPTPDDEPVPPHQFATMNHQSPPGNHTPAKTNDVNAHPSSAQQPNAMSTPASGQRMAANITNSRYPQSGGGPSAKGSPVVANSNSRVPIQHQQQQQYQHQQQNSPAAASVHQPYNRNSMYPGYTPPPAPPQTFTLPESTQALLPKKNLHSVAKIRNGQMAWFTVPPLWVPDRHMSSDNRDLGFYIEKEKKEENDDDAEANDDEQSSSKRLKLSVGHSAKYIAWKMKQRQST